MKGLHKKLPEEFSIYQRELYDRMGWFIQLRWIVLLGFIFGLYYAYLLNPTGLIDRHASIFGSAILFYNLVFTLINYYLHRFATPARWKNITFIILQITLDLMALTLVVHLTGGIRSVFVVLFAVYLVISSVLLRWWLSLLVCTFASLLLNGVYYMEAKGIIGYNQIRGFSLGFHEEILTAPEFIPHIALIFTTAFLTISYIGNSILGRLRKQEEKIEAANRRLEELNNSKSDFMRTTSHEIRAPMSAVQGLLNVLKIKLSKSPCADAEFLDILDRSNIRMNGLQELIADLLEYSRLQTSIVHVKEPGVQIHLLVDEVLEEVKPVADVKGIVITSDLETCSMTANEDDLCTMIKNLICNAIRYTPPGGLIEIGLQNKGAGCVLTVSDNGIGIEKEALESLYDEYFRAPRAREFEAGGTGLGLTLCKQIVENHDGELTCVSEIERGSCFTVRLPLTPAVKS